MMRTYSAQMSIRRLAPIEPVGFKEKKSLYLFKRLCLKSMFAFLSSLAIAAKSIQD